METHQTPEQIIALAMQLAPEQRVAIADALLGSLPSNSLEQATRLHAYLQPRIEAAERGEFSDKTFSQIKHEARLES